MLLEHGKDLTCLYKIAGPYWGAFQKTLEWSDRRLLNRTLQYRLCRHAVVAGGESEEGGKPSHSKRRQLEPHVVRPRELGQL